MHKHICIVLIYVADASCPIRCISCIVIVRWQEWPGIDRLACRPLPEYIGRVALICLNYCQLIGRFVHACQPAVHIQHLWSLVFSQTSKVYVPIKKLSRESILQHPKFIYWANPSFSFPVRTCRPGKAGRPVQTANNLFNSTFWRVHDFSKT